MNATKSCPTCGKEFVDPKHPNRQYCSRACFANIRKVRIDCKCENCGKMFTCRPSEILRFCSRTCANQYNQPPDPKKRRIYQCQECDGEFEEWAYRKPRFCSRLCASKYSARQPRPGSRKPSIYVTLDCTVCGKEYQTNIYQVRLRGSSCCSRECVAKRQSVLKRGVGNPNYRGGTVGYRGPNWGRQSRMAAKRDGYICQICHQQLGRRLWDYAVHHIQAYRTFDGDYKSANQLSNLITLCRSCHMKVEFGGLPCPRPLL